MTITEIFRELFAERTRVILTILAIAWGTASIAVMLGMGEGLRTTFSNISGGLSVPILEIAGGTTTTTKGQAGNTEINLMPYDLSALKQALPDDVIITAEQRQGARITYQSNRIYRRVSGIEPVYQDIADMAVAPGGRMLNQFDLQNFRQVVVIGSHIAGDLFRNGEEPLGQQILIGEQPFTIIGVMESGINNAMFYLDGALLIPATTFAILTNKLPYERFLIAPPSAQQLSTLRDPTRRLIAFNHQVSTEDQNIVVFSDNHEQQKEMNQFFFAMQSFLGLIGSITLLVAGAGIANVMYASVRNATREIGIRMAVGARPYQILRHYILQALVATGLGGLAGLVLTYGIFFIYNQIPVSETGIWAELGGKPEPILSSTILLAIIIILGLIGSLAGLLPARKAAQIDPVEALSYE